MKHSLWLTTMLLYFLLALPSTYHGQTYQGPSGGRGGKPFDHWTESNGEKEIAAVALLEDNSVIRCIYVTYRNGRQTKSGYCDPPPGPLSFNCCRSFKLAPDEYIIGIAGRYGDRVDSLRFYTNKQNSPVYGGRGGTVDFGYTAPSGQKIAAFIGRAGDNLDAIGVLYTPIQ